MERDIALRIDGMIRSINANLDSLAYYIRKTCNPGEARTLIRQVGMTMGESFQMAELVYKQHPDIYPPELIPPHAKAPRAKSARARAKKRSKPRKA